MAINPKASNATRQKYGTYHAKTVLADECKDNTLPENYTYAARILRQAADTLRKWDQTGDGAGSDKSMAVTACVFNKITSKDITEAECWLLLQLLKDVQQWARPEYSEDSAVSCVNYAALKAEALAAK
jgi:hypothetical protein